MIPLIPILSKRCFFIVLLVAAFTVFGLTNCAKSDVNTVTAVKPKTHKRHYNPGKNKRSKRTKTVKLKNN